MGSDKLPTTEQFDYQIVPRIGQKKSASLKDLAASDQSLIVGLKGLDDEQLAVVKHLIDSMDQDPLFIAHDAATC